jgi:hypothetical protein
MTTFFFPTHSFEYLHPERADRNLIRFIFVFLFFPGSKKILLCDRAGKKHDNSNRTQRVRAREKKFEFCKMAGLKGNLKKTLSYSKNGNLLLRIFEQHMSQYFPFFKRGGGDPIQFVV